MKECDPKSLDDYNLQAKMNQVITGAGVDTRAIFSCPGCAAPGWCEFRIVSMHTIKESKPTKCKTCERTFFFRITRGLVGETVMTLCQSGGDDVPDYLPRMHRV